MYVLWTSMNVFVAEWIGSSLPGTRYKQSATAVCYRIVSRVLLYGYISRTAAAVMYEVRYYVRCCCTPKTTPTLSPCPPALLGVVSCWYDLWSVPQEAKKSYIVPVPGTTHLFVHSLAFPWARRSPTHPVAQNNWLRSRLRVDYMYSSSRGGHDSSCIYICMYIT